MSLIRLLNDGGYEPCADMAFPVVVEATQHPSRGLEHLWGVLGAELIRAGANPRCLDPAYRYHFSALNGECEEVV